MPPRFFDLSWKDLKRSERTLLSAKDGDGVILYQFITPYNFSDIRLILSVSKFVTVILNIFFFIFYSKSHFLF